MQTSKPLVLSAPAKLNLFLHITHQRHDGYHELQSIFQLIDFSDTLTFTPQTSGGIQLTCSDPSLETQDNLIQRAAVALEKYIGQTLNVAIHLDKQLPMGGGIGGGSSNCATTLLGLNALFQLDIDNAELQKIGLTLGADVPIFVKGKTSWAEGIGEKLTSVEMPPAWFVIIHPNVHVSTPKLFTHPQLTRNTPTSTIRPDFADKGHNDFEPLVRKLYPEIETAFKTCKPYGNAKLTGSGACLFLKCSTEKVAKSIASSIDANNPDLTTYVAQGLNESSVLQQLNAYTAAAAS
jgi:4-diphosphocytidyl-2-C-methyl-D-erythritol kinase